MNFFIIKHAIGEQTKTLTDKITNKKNVCSSCGGIHLTREGNLRVKIKASKPTNYYKVPQYNVIDSEFIKIITENQFTGFMLKPVEINETQLPQQHISNLKELVIFGVGGYLHDNQGNELEKCKECNKVPTEIKNLVDGLSVNTEQWDGSDIFYYNNWFGMPVVTERVKDKLIEGNIRNIEFIHVNDYIFNRLFKELTK